MNLHTRTTRRLAAVAVAGAVPVLASGCLLTSPVWNQSFASHTNAVPITAWTTTNTNPVKFECSPAYHGGLHPAFGAPTWTSVASVTPTGGALDGDGIKAYSASGSYVLPSACWRQDPANSVWYAAVRARQTGAAGPAGGFFTVDAAGLGCVAESIGDSGSWVSWLGDGCHKTYSGSSTAIPFTIIHASS
jgi:hypothetical protein